ncbi:SusC/RagA family TonB-linked outer membrane protein [Larkinella rosea]|uniref:TonB-dependent receptor n=1 Tax=Larkinella rosea TaxID=2025312 RepID=A0A3P1BQ07_9BACT|nr:TonB-dependent receptor [Larkinella rosea]RRB02684.1 TonB-dependent receptor [Larkinella rosea]
MRKEIPILFILLLGMSRPGFAQMLAKAQTSNRQPVSTRAENRQLKETLRELKNYYKVDLLFFDRIVDGYVVSADAVRYDDRLETNLETVLKPFGLGYKKAKNGGYVITAKEPQRRSETIQNRFPEAGSSHQTENRTTAEGALTTAPNVGIPEKPVVADITIQGKVTDGAKGDELPGVSIVLKGSTRGTTSDGTGNYKLAIPGPDAVLVFSFVGYEPQEVLVGGRSEINVSLKPDIKALSEVVVVGYGVQKKTSVTAAVSTLKGTEIASVPVTNLSNGLGGRLPGVIVKQASGEPGRDGSNIFVRGISSTGNNQPLLIVDGIPRNFQQLDPNTIETFTVLKDAAAVAPYGVAGANGVVLVTTKRGKTGTPSLSYNAYVGFQNPTVMPDYLYGYDFAMLKNAAAKYAGLPEPYSADALQKFKDGSDNDSYPANNYVKEIVNRNAVITTHNIELSGGAERIKYYASLGYQYQAGMWPSTNNKRYNLTMNLDAQATKTTKISFNLNGRVQKSQYPSIGTPRLFELIAYSHLQNGPLFFSNGLNGTYVTGSIYNSGYQKTNTTALYSQLSVEQEIPFIPGLVAKGTIAYDPTMVMDKIWTAPVHLATINTTTKVITDGIFGQAKSSLNQNYNQTQQLTYQASLNYMRSFGKSTVGALAVFEAKANDAMVLGASRRNYNLGIDELDMGSSSNADMTTTGTSSYGRQMGLVYRVTYDYADKYLLEASGRYDGSYYFAPENRFGFFPAFSLGWRLSEENFIKQNVRWIDNLKLRGSYGEVGALAGSAFQFMSTYSVAGPAYVIGGNAVQAIRERNEPNPNITWERAKKTDIGIEGTFWKGLLNIEADYFYEKRSNMLVNPDVIVPAEYGIGLSQVNAGVMQNQGIDLSIGSSHRFSQDLRVSLNGNFTFAKNKLLQVFEAGATYNNLNRRLTGKPLGTQFGYQALGLFQTTDFDETGKLKSGIAVQPWGAVQPGDIRYQDMNNDGKINDDDLTRIGDAVATPRIIYGIAPNIQYKGFTLDILFQGAAKTNFYYTGSAAWAFSNGMGAVRETLDYWTPENPNATYPRITNAPTTNNTQVSSFWIGDASYLRLKSATLSYSLPSVLTQKAKIQNARIYVSGQNILTWTKLRNFDPEITQTNAWSYPQQKVMSVGLNVTF